jgi:phage regulator Rha-like protein
MTNVRSVVQLLRKEHDRLTRQIKGIGAALEAFGATYGMKGTRKISPAGRARIARCSKSPMGKSSR